MPHNDEASQMNTRQERRKVKDKASASQNKSREEKQDEKPSERKRKRTRVRLIPIWARLLIILALLVFSLVAGLITGYGMIGEGDFLQILKWETWDRFLDFINGE